MLFTHGLFTSESVSEGHPDKLADQISDAVLDAFLAREAGCRVACETMLADQLVVVAGEFKTKYPETFREVGALVPTLVAEVLREAGYTDSETGIDPDRCQVLVQFNHQSADISQGVDREDLSLGAGDQGLMFGYATRETPELMPAPLVYAHRLMQRHAALRKHSPEFGLGPDAKAQVSFRYQAGAPVAIDAVVLSTQHEADVPLEALRTVVEEQIIAPVIPEPLRSDEYRQLINPTGRFVTGGPKGDCGLTGRKIIVDTYGGAAPHGGGAFSGKDPSKVDRSAAYMARYLACEVVLRSLAERCLVQLAYAIGVSKPVSFAVQTEGGGPKSDSEITTALAEEFDLTPRGIISFLDLERPIYRPTASYGHFGRVDLRLPWDQSLAAPNLGGRCQ